jgi:hypothetical protein
VKNQKLRILSLLFFAILVLPVIAIAILQIGQAYIQSTREERLHTEKPEQVALPSNKVIWEEDGEELWVGDRMFDVASFYIKDGNYYLTGVYDDAETEVAGSLLHSIFSNDNSDLLHLLLLMQSFFAGVFLIELSCISRFHKKRMAFYFALFPSPLSSVLIPPPRS